MSQRYVIGEAGARKLTAIFNSGTLGPSGSRKNGLAIEDELPAPFSVEWAESVDGGSFIIWIPAESVLLVNGTEVDAAEDLEDAEGDYPSGWYILDGISSGSVIMSIHIPNDSSQEVTVSFGSTADVPSATERVIPVCVASVSRNQQTGVVTVNQFVKSSVIIDNTAEPSTPTPTPFQVVKTSSESGGQTVVTVKITNNNFFFNSVIRNLSDFTVPDGSVTVYLRGQCDLQIGLWTFSIATSPITPSSSKRVVNYKLYDFVNKSVTMDYRTTFMTVFDGINGIYGNDDGNGGNAEIIAGEIEFIGREGSGLTVSTKKADGMLLDIVGRDREEDEFAVHDLKDSHNLPLAKIFSTNDVTLPAGGGSSITADTSFPVITALGYDASTGYIRIKTRTATVVNGVVTAFTAESAWTNAIATTPHSAE